MSIRSIAVVLLCASGSMLVHAQGYMSSPGFSGKHAQFKFSSNQFYDVFEIAPGYTYGGRFTGAWGFGYATYGSGLSGPSFSQRLSALILKQSADMPISLGINIDVQKSFVNSAIIGEDFPTSHFSLSVHYAYRSIAKMQFVPNVEVGTRQDTQFSEDQYINHSDYFTSFSLTIAYTYFYVKPKLLLHNEQKFFQLCVGVFIP
ncbi:hypothetical protein N9Q30_01270 [bacterium]|jgi:hypothetical protein|nr:hypothetical protein [Saprospiraceae bacterium]MDA9182332.1 hypothetical protein [Saprospiraceae bacterium]MDA9301450.1 hypothetical protein [bacterium]HAW04969.1 hypothetical protein [Saprospirales bacterium]